MTEEHDPAGAEAIARVIRQRRTIHSFRDDCPPREVILEAIDLARWAPNHHQTEPWRFHLLGPETIAGIVELNARLVAERKGEAAGRAKRDRWSQVPGWLAVTTAVSDDPVRCEEDYAATCCAIHNFSLVLWSRGIGVKWTTGDVTRHHEFYNLINADPATTRLTGLLWYGYPAQIPDQRRRPVEEIVIERP